MFILLRFLVHRLLQRRFMPLNSAGLQADLTKLFSESKDDTIAKHAKAMADIYDRFAKTAQDFTGDFLLSGNKSGFESTLRGALDLAGNIAPVVGLAYEEACIAYWGPAAFAMLLPPPGCLREILVTHTPHLPGPVFSGIMASVLNPAPAAATKAALWTAAFTAGAHTVTTINTAISIALGVPIAVGPFPIV